MADLLEWTDGFLVGDEDMDREHRNLHKLTYTFLTAFKEGKAQNILDVVLGELIEFTRKHFKNEEKLLRKFDRTQFIAQKDINDQLVRELMMLRDTYVDGKLGVDDITPFFNDWILRHLKSVGRLVYGLDEDDEE